jgi:hypothetical protein
VSGTASHPLTDAQANQVYSAIKAALQIVLTSPSVVEPGQAITAALVPAAPELDASDLANGVLNVGLAAKDVLFSSAGAVNVPDQGDLEGDTLASTLGGVSGGQPFPPAAPVLGGGPVTNPPGTLAQLFGTFALPRLKVRLEVLWKVRDSSGADLKEGSDFVAPQGLASPGVALHVPPLYSELRLDTLADQTKGAKVVCLWAQVTLQLGTTAPITFEVGGVPLLILPLLVPTIVVLASQPNFDVSHDSAALVVVPKHSPFASSEPLFKALRKIESVMDALRGIGGVASFLLGLGPLIDTIPEEPRLRFVAADAINRLGDITIKRKPWWDFLGSDVTFDDRVYSIFVFGLPGTTVHFFNDTNFKTTETPDTSDQGMYVVDIGPELFVTIRTLDTSSLDRPVTLPEGHVVDFEPDESDDNDGRWHTDMSSLKFDELWLREVERPLPVPPLVCKPPRRKPRPPKPASKDPVEG